MLLFRYLYGAGSERAPSLLRMRSEWARNTDGKGTAAGRTLAGRGMPTRRLLPVAVFFATADEEMPGACAVACVFGQEKMMLPHACISFLFVYLHLMGTG